MKKTFLILVSVVFIFNSCEKKLKSVELDNDEITIHYNETYQLNASYSPTDIDNRPTFTWHSENTNVAKTDQNGLIEGVRIGETKITVQTEEPVFKASCRVIVEPISNMYAEPVLDFGETISTVKGKETRILVYEDAEGLVYEGESLKVLGIMYFFEFARLAFTAALFENSPSVMEELKTYLAERYKFIIEDEGIYFYEVRENIIAARSIDSELGLNVIYFENTGKKALYMLKNQFNKAKNQLKEEKGIF